MMHYGVMAMTSIALSISTTAFGGMNPIVTLPLHAKPSTFELCDGYLPIDCLGNHPIVNLPSAQPIAVFVFVMNFNAVSGVQTAFDWPGWTMTFSQWDCLPDQVNARTPANPGGAGAGTISTAFNCVSAPGLCSIGRLFFIPAGSPGCIQQVQSTFPDGIVVLDCFQGTDRIPDSHQLRLGRVCVGTGGIDACAPSKTPVEDSTWGRIKAQY